MTLCKGPCGQEKPLEDFYLTKYGNPMTHCKKCHLVRTNKYRRDTRNRTPESVAANRRWQRLRSLRLMGVSDERLAELDREALEGNCWTCGRPAAESKGGRLHFDHSHKTGKFRGLLCHLCNVGLGHVGEDPDLLFALAAYLLQHEDVLALAEGSG